MSNNNNKNKRNNSSAAISNTLEKALNSTPKTSTASSSVAELLGLSSAAAATPAATPAAINGARNAAINGATNGATNAATPEATPAATPEAIIEPDIENAGTDINDGMDSSKALAALNSAATQLNNSKNSYDIPYMPLNRWFKHASSAIGHLAAMKPGKHQKEYAALTVRGMKRLMEAVQEKYDDDGYSDKRRDFEIMLLNVKNMMKFVEEKFGVKNSNVIFSFNSPATTGGARKTRKGRKVQKGKKRTPTRKH